MLGQLAKCWSAFYDGIALHSAMETEFHEALRQRRAPALPHGISDATRNLMYATRSDITEYFLDRRDYLEIVATLDIAIHIEKLIREDRASRLAGTKNQGSALAQQIVNCQAPHGQPEPAARRLLAFWLVAATGAGKNFQVIDDALQYRNWLAHGARGASPVDSLTPFMLDRHVVEFASFVNAES